MCDRTRCGRGAVRRARRELASVLRIQVEPSQASMGVWQSTQFRRARSSLQGMAGDVAARAHGEKSGLWVVMATRMVIMAGGKRSLSVKGAGNGMHRTSQRFATGKLVLLAIIHRFRSAERG